MRVDYPLGMRRGATPLGCASSGGDRLGYFSPVKLGQSEPCPAHLTSNAITNCFMLVDRARASTRYRARCEECQHGPVVAVARAEIC